MRRAEPGSCLAILASSLLPPAFRPSAWRPGYGTHPRSPPLISPSHRNLAVPIRKCRAQSSLALSALKPWGKSTTSILSRRDSDEQVTLPQKPRRIASLRHSVAGALTRSLRHDGRADCRRITYELFPFYLVSKHKAGVSIRMAHPDLDQPPPEDAHGHLYYVCEETVRICASGVLQEAGSEARCQRTFGLITGRCLLKDSQKMMNAFRHATTNLGTANICVVANCVRSVILDEGFDGPETGPPDLFGFRETVPDSWRLLMPREHTYTSVDAVV